MTADTIISFATAMTPSTGGGSTDAATATAPCGFAALIDADEMSPAPALTKQADVPLPAMSSQPVSALAVFDDIANLLPVTHVPPGQPAAAPKPIADAAPMAKPLGHVMPGAAPVAAVSAPPVLIEVDVMEAGNPIPGKAVPERPGSADLTVSAPNLEDEEGPALLGDAVPSPVPAVAATPPSLITSQGKNVDGLASAPNEVEARASGEVVAVEYAPDAASALSLKEPRVDVHSATTMPDVAPDTGGVAIRPNTADVPAMPSSQAVAAAPPPLPASDAALRLAYAAAPLATAALPQTNAASRHFGAEIGAIVRRQIAAGREEVTVRLDPAEMGKIQIRISFDRGNELRAVVATETPAALELLRRDVGQLDRALAQAGVRTDAASFRFDEGQHGGGFAQSHPGRADRRFTAIGEESAASSSHTPVPYRAAPSGRVDMLA